MTHSMRSIILLAVSLIVSGRAHGQSGPFSDDFESGNLDKYTKSGSLSIASSGAIQGSGSLTGTGSGFVTGTTLGSNWITAKHGEVNADIKLSSSSDRAGIGFATSAGVWIYVEASTTQFIVKTRTSDGTTANVEAKNYVISTNTKYKLTLRWSKKSRSILVILHNANNGFLANITTICGTHDPSNPMVTCTGAGMIDNFSFRQIGTYYADWRVAEWNDGSDLVIVPKQTGFPFSKYLNPGVTLEGSTFRMIWRGGDDDWAINLGYAQSSDGMKWTNYGQKISSYEDPEDPLIYPFGQTGGKYHYYTEAGTGSSGLESHIFGSNDCQTWTNLGAIKGVSRKIQFILDCDNYPQVGRVSYNGTSYKFWAIYEAGNEAPSNGLAFSNDLLNWTDYGIVFDSRDASWSEYWSYQYVNAIATGYVHKNGSVELFYCATEDGGYTANGNGSIASILVDGKAPWKLLDRGYLPWGPPTYTGDIGRGGTPYTYKDSPIFPTAMVVVKDTLFLYYGNNDTSIGVAKAVIADATSTNRELPAGSNTAETHLFMTGSMVSFKVPACNETSVETHVALYATNGREIISLVNKRLSPGDYRVQINAGTLPAGLYLCRMTAGNTAATAAIVMGGR